MHILELTAILTVLIVLRYFLIAGGFYFVFYKLKINRLSKLRIDQSEPKRKIIKQEILWSVGTSVIFGFAGACVYRAWEQGYTRIYTNLDERGWIYLVGSTTLVAFLHDTYFYWMHRMVHHPKLFSFVHKVHHDSNPPTPFAAFSFHWSESILEALIFPVLVILIPLHIYGVVFLLITMTITSVINHLGFEIYPKTRWIISATNHQVHHQVFNKNFGLYFTWWDHWMNTGSQTKQK